MLSEYSVDRHCLGFAVKFGLPNPDTVLMLTGPISNKSVHVQLPTERRAAAPLLLTASPRPCSNRSISPARRTHSRQQTRRGRVRRPNAGTDGRTDSRPLRTDPAPLAIRAVPVRWGMPCCSLQCGLIVIKHNCLCLYCCVSLYCCHLSAIYMFVV